MARFFNKIRQRLASENKIVGYFFYAVGEVVLVVVGILIALAIDNKMEQRQKDAKERIILNEMLDALQSDSLDNVGNIRRNMASLNASEAVLKQLKNRLDWNDSMALHYANLRKGSYIASILSPFENLKFNGLDLVKNDSLRFAITRLYSFSYPFVVRLEQGDMHDFEQTSLNPQLFAKLRTTESFVSARPVDLNKLMDDFEFQEVVRSNAQRQTLIIFFYRDVLKSNGQIMEMIRKELKK